MPPERGLLDTSVFIARETRRPLGALPDSAAVSVVTLAELHLGVLVAPRPSVRTQRLRTLEDLLNTFEIVPIDSEVAFTFAELVSRTKRAGARANLMDTWIAATAVTHALPIYTQDDDFAQIPGVRVYRV